MSKIRTDTRWAMITEGHGFSVSPHEIDLNSGHYRTHYGKRFWVGQPVERQEAVDEFRQYLHSERTKFEDGDTLEECFEILSHTYDNYRTHVVEVEAEIEVREQDEEYETVKAIK